VHLPIKEIDFVVDIVNGASVTRFRDESVQYVFKYAIFATESEKGLPKIQIRMSYIEANRYSIKVICPDVDF
jgi:hypothetical protein